MLQMLKQLFVVQTEIQYPYTHSSVVCCCTMSVAAAAVCVL